MVEDDNTTGGGSVRGNAAKKQGGGSLHDLVKAESMIQLAIAVPLGCLIGWLVGDALDHHFHTSWIGILGIVLGAIGGFIQIVRTAAGFLKRGDN